MHDGADGRWIDEPMQAPVALEPSHGRIGGGEHQGQKQQESGHADGDEHQFGATRFTKELLRYGNSAARVPPEVSMPARASAPVP
jgi:hypothetical protein